VRCLFGIDLFAFLIGGRGLGDDSLELGWARALGALAFAAGLVVVSVAG
jgi:hypothetical protein